MSFERAQRVTWVKQAWCGALLNAAVVIASAEATAPRVRIAVARKVGDAWVLTNKRVSPGNLLDRSDMAPESWCTDAGARALLLAAVA